MNESGPTLSTPPARILVKATNWLGDIVMSLPALRAVRSAFPEAHLAVLIKRELAGFFDGAKWVNELIPYAVSRGLAGWGDRKRIVGEIRRRRFDLAVLFPNSFESAFWPTLARVPLRAGFVRDGRGLLLTHRTRPTPDILETHQVHYYLHMLKETIGVTGDPDCYQPDVDSSSKAKMAAWLKARRKRPDGPLVALAAAAAYGPAKEWPGDCVAALIDLLAEKHGAECVLVGAPSEKRKSEEIVAESKSGGLVAAGETSVGEAVALLDLCAGFAGNDSGSMHVSGALGIPTIGLFGSTRADRTGPLGSKTRVIYHQMECNPCLKRTCRFGHYQCLRLITPEEVAGALQDLGAFKQ